MFKVHIKRTTILKGTKIKDTGDFPFQISNWKVLDFVNIENLKLKKIFF